MGNRDRVCQGSGGPRAPSSGREVGSSVMSSLWEGCVLILRQFSLPAVSGVGVIRLRYRECCHLLCSWCVVVRVCWEIGEPRPTTPKIINTEARPEPPSGFRPAPRGLPAIVGSWLWRVQCSVVEAENSHYPHQGQVVLWRQSWALCVAG